MTSTNEINGMRDDFASWVKFYLCPEEVSLLSVITQTRGEHCFVHSPGSELNHFNSYSVVSTTLVCFGATNEMHQNARESVNFRAPSLIFTTFLIHIISLQANSPAFHLSRMFLLQLKTQPLKGNGWAARHWKGAQISTGYKLLWCRPRSEGPRFL